MLPAKMFCLFFVSSFKNTILYSFSSQIHSRSTFDFLVLKGKSLGQVEEIVLQEMKGSRTARLNDSQKQLRDCVKSGAIRFETWRLDTNTGKWYCK